MDFVPKKLYYKIREVCEIVGVEAHVLRFWETEFTSLTPPKSKSGQRTYRPKDVELLLQIKKLLYEDGYTIAGARKQLSAHKKAAPKTTAAVAYHEKLARIPEEEEASPPSPAVDDWTDVVKDEITLKNSRTPADEPAQSGVGSFKDLFDSAFFKVKQEEQSPKEKEQPTSERLKRVQAELENILTLLDRE